jgi:hypothetical protein
VVGAVIGFVVGYAGALISPLLGFGLILVSAVAFWQSYTAWRKPPPPPKPASPTIEEWKAAGKRRKARMNIERLLGPSATPSSTPGKADL